MPGRMAARALIPLGVLLILAPARGRAAEPTPVAVTIEKVNYTVVTYKTGLREAKEPGPGYYPIGGTETETRETVEVVKLNNGLVEAWVCPAYGARLLRARDLKTGADYFRWRDTDMILDRFPWTTGGVKPSFPFFEHGTHLRQPAGYRVVKHPDGSATVACDMRFTHHTAPADSAPYGRYGDESLNVMVTLKPGSAVVYWRQRKENPNPLPRGDRMWNDACLPTDMATRKRVTQANKEWGITLEVEVLDAEETKKRNRIIFPACWVVDQGLTQAHTSPHRDDPMNWNVSHFALDAPYGFAGVYLVRDKRNCLRINDVEPGRGAAARLLTRKGMACELWGGQGIVFEKPGVLRSAYEPVEFTHRFYLAQGIGEVAYANDDVALAVDGPGFEMVGTREAVAEVSDGTGKVVAHGPVGPHAPLRGGFDGRRLIVKLDGRQVLDRAFPLPRPKPAPDTPVPPEVRAAFDRLVAPDPFFWEKNCLGHSEGQPGVLDALPKTATIQDGSYPAGTMSLARTAYRFGRLDEAARLARLCPGAGADYLLGLIAWEKGEPVDFKLAAWESGYIRALQAIRAGDRAAALKLVEQHLAHVPTAWRPRLAKAFWSGDRDAARKLADENPGSPEAQLVLKLLGLPHELDLLLNNNPSADVHIRMFEDELTRGQWKHMPRYVRPAP